MGPKIMNFARMMDFMKEIDYASGIAFMLGHYNYLAAILLVMIGFYAMISRPNLIKKIIGLNIFQNGVFLFYISLGIVEGAQPPIITEGNPAYANPLPHVLILTAIVVGISTMAVGLGLVVRIGEAYGCVESVKIAEMDRIQSHHHDES